MPDLDRQETRTCLFTDIVGSTDRTARLDTQTAKRIITRTFELFKQCLPKESVLNQKAEGSVEAYVNGRIVADTGDGVFADFTTVGAAIETALKFQWLLAHEQWETEPIEVRIGIDTGDVSFREDAVDSNHEIPVGDVTNRAARIMSCALGGQILISDGVSYHGRQKVVGMHPCAIHQPATEARAEIDYDEIGHVRYKGDQVDAGVPPVLLYEVGVKGQLKKHITSDPEKCSPCDRKGRLAPMSPEFTPVAKKEVPGADGGPWILERRLARGGFGEAWLARHAVRLGEHNKRVFKFPNDPARVRAFLRETNLADILKDKRLQGVVRVEDYRERPCFIATPYYRNGSLLDWSAANKEAFASLSQQQRIDFIIDLARIVEGAHGIGIVHKDIKPANVFLEDDTTRLRPVLADFGVGEIFLTELREEYQKTQSRDLNRAVSIIGSTRTGTEMYWPPEFRKAGPLSNEVANKEEADEQAKKADVYALGILLYQLVIGDFNQPWESAQECERRIPDDPASPLNPFLRIVIMSTLDAVEYRTASAGELAGKLASLEQDCADSEQARLLEELRLSQEKAHEAKKRVGQLKRFLALVACLMVITGVLAVLAVQMKNEAEAANDEKTQALMVAEAANVEKTRALEQAKSANTEKTLALKKVEQALQGEQIAKQEADKQADAARISAAEEKRAKLEAEMLRTLAEKSKIDAYKQLEVAKQATDAKAALSLKIGTADHEAALGAARSGRKTESTALLARALGYNPENHPITMASGLHVFGSGVVTRLITTLGGGVSDMQFDPHSRSLVAGCLDGTLQVMNPDDGAARLLTKFPEMVIAVSLSPDGKLVAAGSQDGTVGVVEISSGKERFPPVKLPKPVSHVRFSNDGRLLAIATGDTEVLLMDAADGRDRAVCRLSPHVKEEGIRSLFFLPDGESLEVIRSRSSFLGLVERFKTDGQPLGECKFYQGVICGGDGRLRITGDALEKNDVRSDGAVLRLSEYDSANTQRPPKGPVFTDIHAGQSGELDIEGSPSLADLSAEGSTIAVVSGFQLWAGDVKSAKLAKIGTMDDNVVCLKISPDGLWAAAGDFHGTLRVFDLAEGRVMGEVQVGPAHVWRVEFSADGRYLAASAGQTTRIIELMPDLAVQRSVISGEVRGQSVPENWMTAFHEKQAVIFDTRTWRTVHQINPDEEVSEVQLSPDRKRLAIGSRTKVELYWVETQKTVWSQNQDLPVTALRFGPDGKYLDIGGGHSKEGIFTGTEGYWKRVESGNGKVTSFDKNPGLPQVSEVQFSADGSKCAIRLGGSLEGKAMLLYDFETGKLIARDEFGSAVTLAFSPDGHFLVAGTDELDAHLVIRDLRSDAASLKVPVSMPVSRCCFTSDGHFLLVSCQDGSLRVHDPKTWRELARMDTGGGGTDILRSSPGCLVVGEDSKTLAMIDPRWFNPSDAKVTDGWRKFLSLQAGMEFRASGKLEPLSDDELMACQDQARAAAQSPPSGEDAWQSAILRWWQMRPEKRTISPWNEATFQSEIGRTLMDVASTDHDFGVIVTCARQAHWHPLTPLSMARRGSLADYSTAYMERFPGAPKTRPFINDVEQNRRQFLARQTLTRLRDADESVYGRAVLAEYAGWTARILKDELGLVVEAREAQMLADELASK